MRSAELDYGREGRRCIESWLNKPQERMPKEKHLRPSLWWMRISYRHRVIIPMRHLWTNDTEEEKWRRGKGIKK